MRTPIPFLMLIFFLTKAGAQEPFSGKELRQLQWLEGSWKGMAAGRPFYEGWRYFNDSVLVNFSIEVNNGDTLIREAGVLLLRGQQVQLMNHKASWRASRLKPNQLVLRNDSLSYSNTIIWLHTAGDHWLAILEHPTSTVYYDMVKDPVLDQKLEAWIRQQREKKN